MNTRFIHTADWQLGMTRHFLSVDAQARFTQARFDAVRAIGKLADSHDAQFVVVAGDVFESNHLQRNTVANAVEAINAIPVPVALLPGNHDPLDASCVFDSAAFTGRIGSHVCVLRDASPVTIVPGVEIVGAPWYSKHPLQDLVRRSLNALEPCNNVRRIAVAHGAVDSLTPDVANPALIDVARAAAAIDAGIVQYLALGDRHSVTDVGANGRIWYSGTPEPTDYTEQKPGFALLVDIDDEGSTSVSELKTGQWHFVRPALVMLNNEPDIDSLAGFIDRLDHKSRTVLKLDLAGTLPLRLRGHFDAVIEHARDLLAAVELGTRLGNLVFMPDEVDAGALGLSGFAAEAFEQLNEKADPTSESKRAQTARDALALLYRLAGSSSP